MLDHPSANDAPLSQKYFIIHYILCFSEKPNTVSVIRENGSVVFQTEYKGPHPKYHQELSPYSAFAPNGTAEVNTWGLEDPASNISRRNVVISCLNSLVYMYM